MNDRKSTGHRTPVYSSRNLSALGGTGLGSSRSPILLKESKEVLSGNYQRPVDYNPQNIRPDMLTLIESSVLVGITYPSGQILVLKAPWKDDVGQIINRSGFTDMISKVVVATSNKNKVAGEVDEEDEERDD